MAVALAVIVVVAAIGVASSAELGVLPPGGGGAGTSTCTACTQQEPVVDVIMPALGSSGNFSNPNRQLNMTAGETKTFEVDVYPTAPLGFTMDFVVLAPGSGGQQGGPGIEASFNPQVLTVGANSDGTTQMTLSVAQSASRGTYDVVVSATNTSNSTEVWGLYFEVSVQ